MFHFRITRNISSLRSSTTEQKTLITDFIGLMFMKSFFVVVVVTCPFWLSLLFSLFICHQVVHLIHLVFRWTRELNPRPRTMAQTVSPWHSPLDQGASLCSWNFWNCFACLISESPEAETTCNGRSRRRFFCCGSCWNGNRTVDLTSWIVNYFDSFPKSWTILQLSKDILFIYKMNLFSGKSL